MLKALRWSTPILSAALLFNGGLASAAGDDSDELGGMFDTWVNNGNGQTTIGGTQQTGGSPGTDGGSGGATPVVNTDDAGYVPPPRRTPAECLSNWDNMISCWEFMGQDEGTAEEEEASTPAIPEITITDLATFSPAPGTLTGEPDNLGVAGLPSNFMTDASVHTESGELFGFPIQVRFTPTTFTFHYGDGESRASDTAGESWDDLDQAQFTPTDTSHSYAERGTYQASVDTTYTAEIDLGVGWFPIAGELTIDGVTQRIRIYEAHTALVAHTCDENPGAPGC